MHPERNEPDNEPPKDKVDVRQGEVRGLRWILIISFSLSAIALAVILISFAV